MRFSILTISFLLFILSGKSVFGQPCYSIASIPFNPTTISGTVVNPGEDQCTASIPIGFTFCFYGINFDSLQICRNGFISFNASTLGSWVIMGPIPDQSGTSPRNCIMLPWQDLFRDSGIISYEMIGAAPNRVFIVDFWETRMYSCYYLFTGQVKMYESTNIIETHISNKVVCQGWNAGKAIHGLHNLPGTFAHVVPGRNSPSQWSASNDGIQFTPSCTLCVNLGIDNSELNSIITIYPNPASDLILVTCSTFTLQGVELFSCDGRLLLSGKFQIISKEAELNLSDLDKGIYFLKIHLEGGRIATKKLLIQ